LTTLVTLSTSRRKHITSYLVTQGTLHELFRVPGGVGDHILHFGGLLAAPRMPRTRLAIEGRSGLSSSSRKPMMQKGQGGLSRKSYGDNGAAVAVAIHSHNRRSWFCKIINQTGTVLQIYPARSAPIMDYFGVSFSVDYLLNCHDVRSIKFSPPEWGEIGLWLSRLRNFKDRILFLKCNMVIWPHSRCSAIDNQ